MRDTVYSMLSPRVPELRSLELLLAVDRAGSIGAAAHEFGLSQQAVSARIRRTEAMVGTALVNRDAHGSTLTDDGRLVAQWARQIIASAQELDIGITALRGDHEAHLRVAASMTVAEYLLPGWLVRFYAQRHATHRSPVNVEMTATNTDTALRMVIGGEGRTRFRGRPGRARQDRLPRGRSRRTVRGRHARPSLGAAAPTAGSACAN